jgi:hypothetical protein
MSVPMTLRDGMDTLCFGGRILPRCPSSASLEPRCLKVRLPLLRLVTGGDRGSEGVRLLVRPLAR